MFAITLNVSNKMLHELVWTIANFLSEKSKVKEIRAENEARYFLIKTGAIILYFGL